MTFCDTAAGPNELAAYFDYAATAPFDERLADCIASASWGNANSLHAVGRAARKQLDDARRRIAKVLGARQPAEMVFTSGGTEGDNMLVAGLIDPCAKLSQTCIVTSNIEHHAVLDSAASLKRHGCKIAHVACDKRGVVTPQALADVLDSLEAEGRQCAVVSIMAVNNELGSIQPVVELAKVAHAHNAKFMTDCVQALGKVEIDLEQSGVDAAVFSGHKLGALKGIGAVYIRRGTKVAPLLYGGGQEMGLRSGTSNVMGAVCMAQAVEFAVTERKQVWSHVADLRRQLLDGLAALEAPHRIAPTLSDDSACVPHTLSLIVDGLEGETVVQRLDAQGIACSSGSACSTGSLDPSYVVMAVGVSKQRAYGSVRLSFGAKTTAREVGLLLDALPHALR